MTLKRSTFARTVVQTTRRGLSDPNYYGHPSQKYTDVYSKYIAMLLPQNGLLVDPFVGSGTSLVACKRLNRKAIGIEIEEKFCRIIVERLSQCELFSAQDNVE